LAEEDKMKIFLGLLIAIVALGIAGYFGLPFLLEKETGGLQTEIQAIKKRLEKVESFVEKEEKAGQEAEVKADAGLPRIIKVLNNLSTKVGSMESNLKAGLAKDEDLIKKQSALTGELANRQNDLSAKVGSLEKDLKTGLTRNEELAKKQLTRLEESLKNQNEDLEKANKEHQTQLQQLSFQVLVSRIKTDILKVKESMLGKNFGLAKNDLGALSEMVEKKLLPQTPEQKKTFEEFRILVEKIKSDMDSDVPAALYRLDLLWLEMDKLVKK
jgi:uncharacterized phage infection (PIP) family protein YhgE